MKKALFIITAIASIVSACNKQSKFQIAGTINGAEGQTLYLEAITLEGIHILDSVRLNTDGAYSFRSEKTVANPEFYALRIETQRIYFSIDSTEALTICSAMPDLLTNTTVDGSNTATDILNISRQQNILQQQIRQLESSETFIGEHYDSISTLIADYKQQMKDEYILKHPERASAYFAVCQSITYQGSLFQIFNPFGLRDDVKCYACVATVWNGRWPEADRTIQLCNIAVKGMENTAPAGSRQIKLDEDKISETGIIDVTLPDINSQPRQLSDLHGQVVLLDFTMYRAPESAARTRAMRELYKKYHARGLEIYQVSLDDDIHFWQFSCENLPWICVHETDGRATRSYAVTSLPTFFLINRDNDIVVRSEMVKNLEEEIQNLL